MDEEQGETSSTLIDVVGGSTRASMFLVTGNVAATVVQAIGVLFVARILGPELYGVYTITFIVPSLAILLSDIGVDAALVKFLAAPPEKRICSRAKILRTGLLIKLSLSAAFLAASLILSEAFAVYLFNRPYIISYMRLASLTIMFQALINSTTNSFVGLGKTEYSAVVYNTQAIGKVVIAIFLVILGLGVLGALIGYISGFFIGITVALLLLLKVYRQTAKNSSESDRLSTRQIAKSMILYGLPLFVVNILGGIGGQYQGIILATFTSNDAIGNYNASMNFISLMGAIAAPMSLAVFQGFSKLSKNGQTAKRFFAIATKYTTLLMVPIALLISLFSKELIFAIYGVSYSTAALYLSLYSLTYLLSGLGSLTLFSMFNGLGETKFVMKMGLVSSVTLFVLAPLLTNFLSVAGMIVAILCSNLAGTVIGLRYASTKLNLELPKREMGKAYLATVLPAILTFSIFQAVPASGMLKVLSGGVLYLMVYLTLLVLLRVTTSSDVEKIRTISNRMTPLRYTMRPVLAYMSFVNSKMKT